MRSNSCHTRLVAKTTGVVIALLLIPLSTFAFQTESKKKKDDGYAYFEPGEKTAEKKKSWPFRPRLHKPDFRGSFSIFRYLPDENSESSVNFDLGVEVRSQVENRFSVFTGLKLFFISQNFPVGSEIVQGRLANGALLAREHVSTDLSVIGFEIPMGISYRIGEKPGSLVISAGLSSRTSLKEKYTDHIDWKMGGTVRGSFVATSTRSTVIHNESPGAFEFFNLFHAGTLALGKSIHIYGAERAEIQIQYTFHLSNVRNIFQQTRFKKFESLALSFKFPLSLPGGG